MPENADAPMDVFEREDSAWVQRCDSPFCHHPERTRLHDPSCNKPETPRRLYVVPPSQPAMSLLALSAARFTGSSARCA